MEQAGQSKSLVNRIRGRQTAPIGHILRREGLEDPIITGEAGGRRGRGRQREQMMDSLDTWMNIKKMTSVIFTTGIEEFAMSRSPTP